MQILFVHQNFPAQFMYLAPALLAMGHELRAIRMAGSDQEASVEQWEGISVHRYKPSQGSTPKIHPWVIDFETKIIRAQAAFKMALAMKESGFNPEVIIAHPGWGDSLFLKEVWPKAKLGIYCEYYYLSQGGDIGFDPEFGAESPEGACFVHIKNLNNQMHFEFADAGIAPTHWQASTFPKTFQKKIMVIHDGINTDNVAPNENASMTLNTAHGQLTLTPKDEIITFVNRNLEPYRGYHIFMRALPAILKERPNAHVLIVGGNDVSYGVRPPSGQTWRDVFFEEVKGQIDTSRVHFLGKVSYPHFLTILQLSSVHVYLTYPFVLGWSFIEAMSAGCAIVAGKTPPVEEVLDDGKTGLLVNFFDVAGLAKNVCDLLADPKRREKLGDAARKFAIKNYDLQKVSLPRQLKWVEGLVKKTA